MTLFRRLHLCLAIAKINKSYRAFYVQSHPLLVSPTPLLYINPISLWLYLSVNMAAVWNLSNVTVVDSV